MSNGFPFSVAAVIKEIGRGKQGARSMSREVAQALYAAMLAGDIPDLELGAILLSLRIKGESVEEISGFLQACRAAMMSIPLPQKSRYAPVLIPSYNGARKRPNLTPLLALLLAREGVPVLVHGVMQDASRITSAQIFHELGIVPASADINFEAAWQQNLPVFLPIQVLAPALHRLLQLRARLGVRNSTHTLVKLLQPFTGPALRLSSYTHPEYLQMLTSLFQQALSEEDGAVLLMRGTEGETVASTGRARQIEVFHAGGSEVLIEKALNLEETELALPDGLDAQRTAMWIRQVLSAEIPVPANIAAQVRLCKEWSAKLAGERRS